MPMVNVESPMPKTTGVATMNGHDGGEQHEQRPSPRPGRSRWARVPCAQRPRGQPDARRRSASSAEIGVGRGFGVGGGRSYPLHPGRAEQAGRSDEEHAEDHHQGDGQAELVGDEVDVADDQRLDQPDDEPADDRRPGGCRGRRARRPRWRRSAPAASRGFEEQDRAGHEHAWRRRCRRRRRSPSRAAGCGRRGCRRAATTRGSTTPPGTRARSWCG